MSCEKSRTRGVFVLIAILIAAVTSCESGFATTPAADESSQVRQYPGTVPAPSIPAVSVAAAAPTVLYACYIKSNGSMYRIKEPGLPSECISSNHAPFSWTDGAGAVTDHGALTGLVDDDHPQYLLTNGARALTGDLSMGSYRLTNLAAATTLGDAVRYEQAVKSGDAASGDLGGSYPGPTVAKLQGVAIDPTAPANGQVLTYNGTAWAPSAGAISGHERVFVISTVAVADGQSGSVTASCPPGKVVVGGGYSGIRIGVWVTLAAPITVFGSQAYVLIVENRSGSTLPAGSLHSHAICVNG